MEYTINYQLPTWIKEDRIRMEDFNDMTAKLDATLGEQGNSLQRKGNCIIVHGSYTGNGKSGSGNKTKLTFDRPPLLIVICPHIQYSSSELDRFIMVRGAPWSFTVTNTANSSCTVAWLGNTVSWYGYNDFYQANRNKETYHYIALLSAEDTE